MYLKSITMKGFKSFPDRTRLEFGPGTSVIVGPNGSGKSNVTDAVLWALGEQSPMAVRGHSMQDVIFGGAPGRQAASSASVELVLDDSEGMLGFGPEVSIMRRLDRSGDGEYRIGGAKCRLIDVIEVLSDTGLGKEMHSVISQGRVEAIVTSKPRDRRLLIEEAAGLGKHRKRRRRAQLKLGHTQDNLDRALDVEREARSRLKPLKRQAEAAELHERLYRQTLEVRWELARDELRARRAELAAASEQATQARAQRGDIAKELEAVSERRRQAEEALAARSSQREELSRRSYGAQSAADKIGYRAEAVRDAGQTVSVRLEQARAQLEQLGAAAAADQPDTRAQARIDALSRELEALERDREAELARQLAELEQALAAAGTLEQERAAAVELAKQGRDAAEATYQQARAAVRDAERVVEAARRESARIGGELAAVNQFLRSHQGAPGGARSLADELTVTSGYELAVAAALDGRLGAALLDTRAAAGELLDKAGRDGGRVIVLRQAGDRAADASSPPVPGSVRLREYVSGDSRAASIARDLLRHVWVVDDLSGLPDEFEGVAVTTTGRVYSGFSGELRQTAKVGEERVLAERNRRDELIAASERAVQAEHLARGQVEAAGGKVAELDAAREQTIAAHRAAVDSFDEVIEQQRRLTAAIQRRRTAPDEGPGADRRAQIQMELRSEQSQLERAERERAQRQAQIARLQAEIGRDEQLAPSITAIYGELSELAAAVADCKAAFDQELARDREAGESVAAELRSCAQEEAAIQTRLHAAGEALTTAEVRSQRSRDQEADAEQALRALAGELELEPAAAEEPLAEERREELRTRLERLAKRREQLGPVNPLAQDEYADALAHVEELETQRNDLETALRELEGLIKDTDRQIRETFEQTFEAAAANFEELAARVFPGGSGRLRLVSETDGRAPVIGGQKLDPAEAEAQANADAEVDEADELTEEEDLLGVEIEITPAGKAMKRLTLLSGGEKSMTALAFLFAVFLAKPCPFYIMDEVEAALDDLNISRFLDLLDTYNDRAQFIVVTHQKRTMEAADSLYGVSMGGDGISKVISRRLPEREAVA
ncbi:MAG TPA: AAA family ATPase [Solirubrobacteraceae bacterium]|nr:AAA family ATPase [Solirubrobacteraceae bacterium]